MAVLVASGTYMPKGLTSGPTHGPEDFQELVFTVFSRRLYKEWFLFLDDLSVATGRPPPHPPGPSGAHDVVCASSEPKEPAKARKSLNGSKHGKAYRSDITSDGHTPKLPTGSGFLCGARWMFFLLVSQLLVFSISIFCVTLFSFLDILVIGGLRRAQRPRLW